VRFDMARVEEYRNFCNKLWNAARYVLMNVEDQDLKSQGAEFSLADRWIRSRLAVDLTRIEAGFRRLSASTCGQCAVRIYWHEFCDWYVELSKAVLQSESASPAAKRGTRLTLVQRSKHCCAPCILSPLLSPRRYGNGHAASAGAPGRDHHARGIPTAAAVPTDVQAEPEMRWVMTSFLGVRQIKGEMDIAPNRKLEVAAAKCAMRGIWSI